MTQKWGWYVTFYHLAGGDILRIQQVTETSVRQVFTFLCYEIDLHISKNNKMPENARK